MMFKITMNVKVGCKRRTSVQKHRPVITLYREMLLSLEVCMSCFMQIGGKISISTFLLSHLEQKPLWFSFLLCKSLHSVCSQRWFHLSAWPLDMYSVSLRYTSRSHQYVYIFSQSGQQLQYVQPCQCFHRPHNIKLLFMKFFRNVRLINVHFILFYSYLLNKWTLNTDLSKNCIIYECLLYKTLLYVGNYLP